MSIARELPETFDFGNAEDEYRAFTAGAALVDRTFRSRLAVRGSDRTTFLQRLVSNDVAALKDGQGCAALLLMPKGQLISELNIHHLGDEYLIDYPAAMRAEILMKLTMYVLSSDVGVEDRTDSHSQFGLYGPSADEILAGLGANLPGPGLYANGPAEIAGHPVTLVRTDPVGVEGFEVFVESDAADSVSGALHSAGGVPAGSTACEWRRIGCGRPLHGAEMGPDLLPPEIPLLAERAVSYTKGCFVGQETVARIKNYGHVNRELRCLRMGGDAEPAAEDQVFVGDKVVGKVTSACTPPDSRHPIALAFVKRKHFEPGTEVEVGDGRLTATVAW